VSAIGDDQLFSAAPCQVHWTDNSTDGLSSSCSLTARDRSEATVAHGQRRGQNRWRRLPFYRVLPCGNVHRACSRGTSPSKLSKFSVICGVAKRIFGLDHGNGEFPYHRHPEACSNSTTVFAGGRSRRAFQRHRPGMARRCGPGVAIGRNAAQNSCLRRCPKYACRRRSGITAFLSSRWRIWICSEQPAQARGRGLEVRLIFS